MSVCLYRRISLTTVCPPLQCSAGHRKVYNYCDGGYHYPPERNFPRKNNPPKLCEIVGRHLPQVSLETSKGVVASLCVLFYVVIHVNKLDNE